MGISKFPASSRSHQFSLLHQHPAPLLAPTHHQAQNTKTQASFATVPTAGLPSMSDPESASTPNGVVSGTFQLPIRTKDDLGFFTGESHMMELPIRTKVEPSAVSTNVFRQMELAIRTKTNGSPTPARPPPSTSTPIQDAPTETISVFDPRDDEQANINVNFPNFTVARYAGVPVDVLNSYCPLMYHSIERRLDGSLEIDVYVPSAEAFDALLLYLYRGYYITEGIRDPLPLVRHLEIYKVAREYNYHMLLRHAYVGFLYDIQRAYLTPEPPAGLLEGIRFIFMHLGKEERILSSLLNYCLTKFTKHSLGRNEDFCVAVAENTVFQQALIKRNIDRGFQDEGADCLIRLIDHLATSSQKKVREPEDNWEQDQIHEGLL